MSDHSPTARACSPSNRRFHLQWWLKQAAKARDPLEFLAVARRAPISSAYHQNQYLPHRRRVMAPCYGLRAAEAYARSSIALNEAARIAAQM